MQHDVHSPYNTIILHCLYSGMEFQVDIPWRGWNALFWSLYMPIPDSRLKKSPKLWESKDDYFPSSHFSSELAPPYPRLSLSLGRSVISL